MGLAAFRLNCQQFAGAPLERALLLVPVDAGSSDAPQEAMMAITVSEIAPRVMQIARRIDAEFDEMPGMRLTYAQVRRLWSLNDHDCHDALEHLCASGHLALDSSGRYLRRGVEY